MADDLIVLMPLAGQENHIALSGQVDRPADGLHPVTDPDPRGCGTRQAGFNFIDDALGILGPGVVAGQDHQIRKFRGDLPHQRPLQAVPVPAAAEQADQPSRRRLPKAAQDLFQGIRLVGVVDQDMVVSVRRDGFQASLDAVGGGEGLRALSQADSFRMRRCQHRQGV